MKNILFILGTRPEAIKLAPIILEFKKNKAFQVYVCNTEQQKELSNQTLSFFDIDADYKLDVMSPNQSLTNAQCKILNALQEIISHKKFDAIVVQGDTLTVLSGALVAFYNKIPLFHVEAGLRSYDLFEPFPEEGIRQMVSRITNLHFAPTQKSFSFLSNEGIDNNKIKVTGNTVIDALNCLSNKTMHTALSKLSSLGVNVDKDIVLITAHRRENHGKRLDSIIESIIELSNKYPSHQFVIPVHPNPNVKNKIHQYLSTIDNIILTDPLDYPCLVSLLKKAKLVLTDSGGIQEEAPTFGVPILVMRYETERSEGIEKGFAKLVGADKQTIIREAAYVLDKDFIETRLDGSKNPYGDGFASKRIMEHVLHFFK